MRHVPYKKRRKKKKENKDIIEVMKFDITKKKRNE